MVFGYFTAKISILSEWQVVLLAFSAVGMTRMGRIFADFFVFIAQPIPLCEGVPNGRGRFRWLKVTFARGFTSPSASLHPLVEGDLD